ncbi:TPA: hypothetical protein JAX20_001130 [Enterobacter hormaechei]|nr:hypothetical protein [Enterobacter hormaechei]
MVTRLSGTPLFAKSRLKKLIKAASGGLFYARQRVTTEGKAMEFSDIHASMLIMTDRENQLSSDMQGDWKVLRVDDLSFTISRPDGGQEEHFSPCASINFIAA